MGTGTGCHARPPPLHPGRHGTCQNTGFCLGTAELPAARTPDAVGQSLYLQRLTAGVRPPNHPTPASRGAQNPACSAHRHLTGALPHRAGSREQNSNILGSKTLPAAQAGSWARHCTCPRHKRISPRGTGPGADRSKPQVCFPQKAPLLTPPCKAKTS